MDNKLIGILAVVVVAVVAIAAVVIINNNNNNGGGDEPVSDDIKALTGLPSSDSRLWVYGNANEDDVIDSDDVAYLKEVIKNKGTGNKVLCDANRDGWINDKDVAYTEKIITASADETTKLDVYYVDNYNTPQKVSWPVKSIAIGYCSGVYTAEATGLMDKVKMVDGTIKNKNWWKLNSNLEAATSFGSEESPDWEAILKGRVDVYCPGYCVAEPDKIAREQLKGIDVMFMNTCDNEGLQDFPNEYIDRSIVMFGYLLQGDLEKTYAYLDWHDEVLSKLENAAKSITDKKHFLMSRSSPGQAVAATYSITGKDNTNNIHAEWVGVYSIGMHDTEFLKNNYNNLTMEQIHTLLTKDSADVVYWMDNCHDGFRHTYDLDTSVAGWADALKDSGKTIHYMGMAREAGNSPLYVVELAFYQNVMYPELDTGLDFAELFQYFVDNFTDEPEKYAGYDINDFFKDFGVM